MLPVITVAGDQATGIVNGAVVVETIFGFPGIGKLMIDAVLQRDFAIVQAAVLVTAVDDLLDEHPDRPRLCDARSTHPARLMEGEPIVATRCRLTADRAAMASGFFTTLA